MAIRRQRSRILDNERLLLRLSLLLNRFLQEKLGLSLFGLTSNMFSDRVW